MRIVVAGAGIGGLTFAQALRDHADVQIVERDADAVSTGGYRLALNGAATAVLERHLDADLLTRIRAVSDGRDRFATFTVATERLRPLLVGEEDAGEDRLLAQRRALRLLLTTGLEDRIRWSTRVTGVEQRGDGAVVRCDSGETLRADLVVGAEGAGSPTVRSLVGRRPDRDLGLVGIAGSAPRVGRNAIPAFLRRGPALVFAPDGIGMFLSLTAAGSGPLTPELRAAVGPPCVVWGLIAPARVVGPTSGASTDELIATALRLTARWHPWTRRRIAASLPDRVAAFPFRAADPTADLTPWRPRNVTALGDAVHAMPPTGGRAAATAIRDAGDLADRVLTHLRQGVPLSAAIDGYHRALREWAVPALRESLGPVRIIHGLGNPVATGIARPLLRLAEGALRGTMGG